MTRRVLVVGGGENAEHEVSLKTAAAVEAALRRRGFAADTAVIGRDGRWRHRHGPLGETAAASLAAALPLIAQADVVFPAVHGPLGEDGTLAALCALAHKPMVGSGLRAGAIAMDKWATKLVAEAIGLRTAGGRLVRVADRSGVAFAGEAVVKPAAAGSSVGVTLVRTAAQLGPALDAAARYGDRILVEPVVHGREIDVGVLREADGRCWAAPPLEIHADGIFDTAAKYDGTARFTVPADLAPADEAALAEAALRLFEALGCAGVARLDFFLTVEGPVLNEVNTMPGMTAESQAPKMFAAAGVPYEELVARLVAGATAPECQGTAVVLDGAGNRP